ncbi:MazG-like nucleotide pyrophosphohydrolase [Rhodococcus phage MacGully]|nr:MazG-like nucleotide pyrophosphohydrolase [Rhodococcus phage MacGully]
MSYESRFNDTTDFEGVFEEDGVTLTPLAEQAIEGGLRILAEAAHRNARAKGWYDRGRELPEELALVHSEVSEVLEEYRDGRRPDEHYYSDQLKRRYAECDFAGINAEVGEYSDGTPMKPEGIGAELGDILIRVGDLCGNPDRPVDIARGTIEKLRYNQTRPARHGGKVA